MKRLLWALVALLILIPPVLYSAQDKTSFWYFSDSRLAYREYQLIRLDIGANIAGTGPVGGEVGDGDPDGDYTQYVDARAYTQVALYVFEYGGGSTTGVKLWDCLTPLGLGNSNIRGGAAKGSDGPLSGIGDLGVEAPTAAPTAADPDPLCVDITAGAGVTIIGTTSGVQKFVPARQPFSFLVAEIDECTGECDMSIHLRLNR